MPSTLYIVATPIGNLEDITYRAVRIFKQVDLIAAEDTRHTLQLLRALEIQKPLLSLHEHNEQKRIEEIARLLEEGKDIALVSDAGHPVFPTLAPGSCKRLAKKNIPSCPFPAPAPLSQRLALRA